MEGGGGRRTSPMCSKTGKTPVQTRLMVAGSFRSARDSPSIPGPPSRTYEGEMQSANELLLQHSKFAPKPPRSSSPLPLPLLFPQNESRKRKTQNVKIITPPSFPRKKSYLRTPPLNPNPQNRRTFHLRLSGRHPTCDDQVISNHSFQFPTTRFSFSSQIQKFKKKQPSQTLTPVLHLGLR